MRHLLALVALAALACAAARAQVGSTGTSLADVEAFAKRIEASLAQGDSSERRTRGPGAANLIVHFLQEIFIERELYRAYGSPSSHKRLHSYSHSY